MKKAKKLLSYGILLVLAPGLVWIGLTVFRDRSYAYISLLVALAACVPFFLRYEKKSTGRELVLIAVMVALSSLGRIVFVFVPFFKPVTAVVIITALYLGGEAGFLTGALSAIVSNLFYGQGPWTPFQMFTWGMIGLLAGLFARWLLKNRILLCVYGAMSGVIFSAIMDVWTTMMRDGAFSWSFYLAALTTALPVTLVYLVSNVIFLLLLTRPMGEKLERVKVKYGLMQE